MTVQGRKENQIHHEDTKGTEGAGCDARTNLLRVLRVFVVSPIVLDRRRAAGDETCFLRNEANFAREARINLRRSRYCTRVSSARLRA